tara:strand:- start:86 stop:1480 length:1395 start_codon:yes stop_codon:yes gene_type:complete
MGDKYKNLFSTKSVYKIEQHLYENGTKGFSLMMKAAFAAYEHINLNTVGKVIILCGKGNNGGDGFGLGALLFMAGRIVEIYKVEEPIKKEAKSALKLCLKLGVEVKKWSYPLKEADIYVDALLGAGIQKSPKQPYKSIIKDLIKVKNKGKEIISLDVPSGVDGTTGVAYFPSVDATTTITFLAMKKGLLTGDAVDHTGDIIFKNIGINRTNILPDATLLEESDCHFSILKPSSHKGTKGSVLVLGGMKGMEGAGILSGISALRSGAGKVFWVTDTEKLDYPPELITVKPDIKEISKHLIMSKVCVLGPGLSSGFEEIIQTIWSFEIPLVIDAGGLRWLAKSNKKRNYRFIGTPHEGEAIDLVEQKKLDRFRTIEYIKKKYGGDWVLKGAGTLIHESNKLCINNFNMPDLGTAGSGDILAGLIAGIWSAGSKTPARSGVWLHTNLAKKAIENKTNAYLSASDLLN